MKYPRIHNKYASMFIWVTEICRFALYFWSHFGEYKNVQISLIFQRIKKINLVLKLSHQKIRNGTKNFEKKIVTSLKDGRKLAVSLKTWGIVKIDDSNRVTQQNRQYLRKLAPYQCGSDEFPSTVPTSVKYAHVPKVVDDTVPVEPCSQNDHFTSTHQHLPTMSLPIQTLSLLVMNPKS